MSHGTVVSVNLSERKGTVKHPVATALIQPGGVRGDAHAGTWHRQVSLLSRESMDRFGAAAGRTYEPGMFAENLTTAGLDLATVRLQDRFRIGGVELEVTQIGKECHGGGCAIFREVGQCVMPKEGIFTRVLSAGEVRPGDAIVHEARPLRAAVVTLSDRASRGEYEDRSGPAVRRLLEQQFQNGPWGGVVESLILPDDAARLEEVLRRFLVEKVDLVVTTGGTGIGPRDITPEVVTRLLTRPMPGIMEYIRVKYGATLPAALLSRGVAGLMEKTLIFTLPGSVRAVEEYMAEINRVLDHALRMRMGLDAH